MTENTSVGSIQMDFEINQKSVDSEMKRVSSYMGNGFKGMFSGMANKTNDFMRNSLGNMSNGFKNLSRSGIDSNEKVSKSINKMNSEYQKTESKISDIRSELKRLFAEQDNIARNFQGMPAFSGMSKDQSMDQMLKSNPQYQKLAEEIEKLTAKINPLINKNKTLGEEIKNVGSNAEATGSKIDNMGNSTKRAGKDADKATWKTRLFGDEMKSSGVKAAGFAAMINRSFRTILRRIFIYSLIMKGIRGVMSHMGAALKTNKDFVNSLNQIKTNLLVAFQPIYHYILPALNALMRAVATVTTYIASAISALFGTTYKKSYGAAKNLENAKKGMDGYGKAAKKAGKDAKGALMGFDEINQLDINDDTDSDSNGGGGPGDFEMTMPDTSTIDLSGLEKIKEIMASIIEPFKLAWDKEGQATIGAIKNAFRSILDLSKSIGKSWLEVWANDTGQKTVENILKILQNIFNIVGNIATAFRNAWEENKVGTRIIQSMFDIFNIILETIGKITKSTAEWAKTLDFSPLLESISKLLEALKPLTQNIGDGLVWLWENALLPLAGWVIEDALPSFLNMLAGAIDVLNATIEVLKPLGLWLWEKFLEPLAKWTGGAIIAILDGIAYAFENIADYIEGIQDVIANSDGFLNALVNVGVYLVEGLFKGIISAIAGIGTWLKENLVDPIVNWVKKLFGIQSPSTVFMEIGTWLVEGLCEGISNTWSKVTDYFDNQIKSLEMFFKDSWNNIKKEAVKTWGAIKDFFMKTWDSIKDKTSETWNGIKEFLSNTWDSLKESTIESWTIMKEFISESWDNIKTKTSETWNNIKSFLIDKIWNPIKDIAKIIWDGIKKNILDPMQQTWAKLKELWDKMKKYILDKWAEIKKGIEDMKDDMVNAIKSPFIIAEEFISGIITKAYDWGANLIGNFIDGIKSMTDKVANAVSGVVDGVKDFLGFSSPTKKGPGSDADKWMPNLMGMLADGIQDNIYQVSAAVSMTAGSIEQGTNLNTDDMASALGSVMLQSMQLADSNQSQGDTTVEFNIDGTSFARLIIPYLDKEKGRTGNSIIEPI